MNGDETELDAIFFPEGRPAQRGIHGVERIYLTTDGNGPSGYYDRVHVIWEDGRHHVWVAHHLAGWRLVE